MTTFSLYSAEKPFVVVIDAGHGGKDAGAIGYSLKLKEKNVNLKTALKLGSLLEKEEGVKVVYTRKKDVFIPLHERARIANKAKADLFISIHTNAAENRSASGTETYALGSSSANLEVAMRENSVILYETDYKTKYQGFDNSSESYIMFDYTQSNYINQSLSLAAQIERRFSSESRKSRGVKQAGFLVLKETAMPGVLVELGYISNKAEEAFLSKDSSLDKMAAAIHRAFVSYKKRHDRKDGTTYQEEVKQSQEEKEKKVEPKNEPAKTVEQPKKEVAQSENVKKDPAPRKETTVKEETTVKKVSDEKKGAGDSDEEIRFGIQIASLKFQKDLNSPDFKGFVPVREFIGEGTYKYQYVYGNLESLEKAYELREEVKKKHPDAFMVVIRNGKKLSNEEARKYWNK
jgi:N-acetylmuramoyl-L-alanine amidase